MIRRLQVDVAPESSSSAAMGERAGRAYVGTLEGLRSRIRLARQMSAFYATYMVGQAEDVQDGSIITFQFRRRTAAEFAVGF